MIVLLNYLPWIIVALAIALMIYKPLWRTPVLIVAIILVVAIIALTPSYIPKGTERHLPDVELPEPRDIGARDVLLKPKPEELEEFEKRADWKKQVEENKKNSEN